MITDIHSEKILILDFGSQVTQLIARRVREQRVYCEIHPFNMPMARIREFAPRGIILSGGPSSVYDKDAPLSDPGSLPGDSGSRHLLRHAAHDLATGGAGGKIGETGIRPGQHGAG